MPSSIVHIYRILLTTCMPLCVQWDGMVIVRESDLGHEQVRGKGVVQLTVCVIHRRNIYKERTKQQSGGRMR
jgi:hypothetical protein